MALSGAHAEAGNKAGKILVVVTGVNSLEMREGVKHPTGYFLPELTGPVLALKDAGYEIDFATPNGVRPVMDKISDSVKWFSSAEEYRRAVDFVLAEPQMQKPKTLESISNRKLEKYRGVFFPGGHGPMEDLYKNAQVGRILNHFHATGKPTVLICHGPAALLAAFDPMTHQFIYAGYKMTAFSTTEEQLEETQGALDGHVKFYLEDALHQAGAEISVAEPWHSNVIVDRELITGQNPTSEAALTSEFLRALKQGLKQAFNQERK